MAIRFGIDLGGTKIELIALGGEGKELLRKRVPTPQGDYGATVRTAVSLVLEAEKELKSKATVGVGIPGSQSRVTGLIKNANSTCLIGHDLKGDLEKALGRWRTFAGGTSSCRTCSRQGSSSSTTLGLPDRCRGSGNTL